MAHTMVGQTVSEVTVCNTIGGQNSLIRLFGPNNDMVIYTLSGTSHKIIGSNGTNNYQFTLPAFNSPAGDIRYTVYDMHILGKTLFLCGSMYTSVPDIQGPTLHQMLPNNTIGFIARVELDNMLASSSSARNIKISYNTIDNTRSIRRFSVKNNGSDTLIAMIGDMGNNGVSCFATMRNYGPIWKQEVFNVLASHETFTDITFTEKHVVIASRLAEDHNSFGLRVETYHSIFYLDNLSNLNTLNVFPTDNTIQSCWNEPGIWHDNDADIRILDMGDNKHVTLAYECKHFYQYLYPDNYTKYLSLYHIDYISAATPIVRDAKSLSILTDINNEFVDIRRNPNTRNVALLCRLDSIPNFTSQLIRFTWGVSSTTCHVSRSERFNAMDIIGNRMVACGESAADGRLVKYTQNLSYNPLVCLEKTTNDICNLAPLPVCDTFQLELGSNEKHISNWMWQSKIVAKNMATSQVCSTIEEDYQ